MSRVLFNILSGQPLQNLLAIRHVQPDTVVAFATPQMTDQAAVLARVSGVQHEAPVPFDPTDFTQNLATARQEILRARSKFDEVVVNFTGGTKVMSISVVEPVVALEDGRLSAIYVDTARRKVIRLMSGPDGRRHEHEELECRVKFREYLALQGEKLGRSQPVATTTMKSRQAAAEALAMDARYRSWFKMQREGFVRSSGRTSTLKEYFRWSGSDGASLAWGPTEMMFEGQKLPVKDGGVFLTGGWLEEFVQARLQAKRGFDEVVRSAVLKLRPETLKRLPGFHASDDKNELDVVVTRLARAALIECKSGRVTQDSIYKLHSLCGYLFGAMGVPVLVSRFKPPLQILEKCNDLRVTVVSEHELDGVADRISQVLG